VEDGKEKEICPGKNKRVWGENSVAENKSTNTSIYLVSTVTKGKLTSEVMKGKISCFHYTNNNTKKKKKIPSVKGTCELGRHFTRKEVNDQRGREKKAELEPKGQRRLG